MRRTIVALILIAIVAGGIVWWQVNRSPALPDPPQFVWTEGHDPQLVTLVEAVTAETAADPSSAAKRAKLAMVFHANGMPVRAEAAYLQALVLDENQPQWWYQLARARAELGQYEQALLDLQRAADSDESVPSVHWREGDWRLELGQLDRAMAAYQRAVQLDPNNLAARVGLARLHLLAGRPAEAVPILEQLVQQVPQASYLHQLLGAAYQRTGRFPAAAAQFNQVQGVAPAWPDPWAGKVAEHRTGYWNTFQRSEQLSAAGRTDEAITMLRTLQDIVPDDSMVPAKIGEIYIDEGDLARARQALEQSLRLDQNNYSAQLHMARVFQLNNDLPSAMAHVEKAIEIHPTFGPAYRQRADLYIIRKDWPAVEAALTEAIRYGYAAVRTQVDLASVQYQLEKYDQASESLERVLAQNPAHIRAMVMLALVKGELGDFDAANLWLARARQFRPNDATINDAARKINELQEATPSP